jgi:hypothetical protein
MPITQARSKRGLRFLFFVFVLLVLVKVEYGAIQCLTGPARDQDKDPRNLFSQPVLACFERGFF